MKTDLRRPGKLLEGGSDAAHQLGSLSRYPHLHCNSSALVTWLQCFLYGHFVVYEHLDWWCLLHLSDLIVHFHLLLPC